MILSQVQAVSVLGTQAVVCIITHLLSVFFQEGLCFCDFDCHMYNNCCSDIAMTCPLGGEFGSIVTVNLEILILYSQILVD